MRNGRRIAQVLDEPYPLWFILTQGKHFLELIHEDAAPHLSWLACQREAHLQVQRSLVGLHTVEHAPGSRQEITIRLGAGDLQRQFLQRMCAGFEDEIGPALTARQGPCAELGEEARPH
jgi:hypothetical protein